MIETRTSCNVCSTETPFGTVHCLSLIAQSGGVGNVTVFIEYSNGDKSPPIVVKSEDLRAAAVDIDEATKRWQQRKAGD